MGFTVCASNRTGSESGEERQEADLWSSQEVHLQQPSLQGTLGWSVVPECIQQE